MIMLYSRVFIIINVLDKISFEKYNKFLKIIFNFQEKINYINIFVILYPEVILYLVEYFEEYISKKKPCYRQ
jgi:hypothetical protein